MLRVGDIFNCRQVTWPSRSRACVTISLFVGHLTTRLVISYLATVVNSLYTQHIKVASDVSISAHFLSSGNRGEKGQIVSRLA